MIACAPTEKLRVLDMLLLCNDLDKDAVNNRGMTALHQAAWYGQEKAVDMLLRAGAALDVKTPAGLTAADIATQMGHADTLSRIDAEAARRSAPAVETAEQLRARLKVQYCQGTASRRRQMIAPPPPRPLLLPALEKEPTPALPVHPSRSLQVRTRDNVPPEPSPQPPTRARTEMVGATASSGNNVSISACDIVCRESSKSAIGRWLPSSTATARERKERDDAAVLPQRVSSSASSTALPSLTATTTASTHPGPAASHPHRYTAARSSPGAAEGGGGGGGDAFDFLTLDKDTPPRARGGGSGGGETGGCGGGGRGGIAGEGVSDSALFFITELELSLK